MLQICHDHNTLPEHTESILARCCHFQHGCKQSNTEQPPPVQDSGDSHSDQHVLTPDQLAQVVLSELGADPEGHVFVAGRELAVTLELGLQVTCLELLQEALIT